MAIAQGQTVPGRAWRLVRDMWTVFADAVYWLWTRLYRLNRGLARTFLPGQSRHVHRIVALFAVCLEIVGIWVAASGWAATH